MISFSAISGRFFSVVPETTVDTATFIMSGFVVKSIEEKKNKAGEIYRYDFSIGQQNYKGDNMSVFGFNVQPTNVELREGVGSWKVGDTVRIVETRPLSKTKYFRLVEIVEKAVIL